MPPQLASKSLSLTQSHRTVQNLLKREVLRISLKEKASARSAMVSWSMPESLVSVFCSSHRAQTTTTRRPLAASRDCPSKFEWRMPLPWVSTSMATWRVQLPSQSENLGAVSSVGSSFRQVVIHLTSVGPRPF